ncbi:hypothetical protein [Streptomyces sasae]|uniref:hypothetical protein n=1 Tax=Streptomyces sasae TaxID=1266772 RepID=UPI00292D78A8|nr:hypothetical protein [Streptomyces sasae]
MAGIIRLVAVGSALATGAVIIDMCNHSAVINGQLQSTEASIGGGFAAVSPITQNCGSTTDSQKSFTAGGTVARVIQLEDGSSVSGGTKLGSDIFEIGLEFNTQEIDIERDGTATGFSFTRTDTVLADHIDGRLWLRNVKCGTPQAGALRNSDNSVRIEPGFQEGGDGVTDAEVPLSEVEGLTVS